MVRFIIAQTMSSAGANSPFTFQYGQIYYIANQVQNAKNDKVYIPIWLDLLLGEGCKTFTEIKSLHSNMVRFIIKNT